MGYTNRSPGSLGRHTHPQLHCLSSALPAVQHIQVLPHLHCMLLCCNMYLGAPATTPCIPHHCTMHLRGPVMPRCPCPPIALLYPKPPGHGLSCCSSQVPALCIVLHCFAPPLGWGMESWGEREPGAPGCFSSWSNRGIVSQVGSQGLQFNHFMGCTQPMSCQLDSPEHSPWRPIARITTGNRHSKKDIQRRVFISVGRLSETVLLGYWISNLRLHLHVVLYSHNNMLFCCMMHYGNIAIRCICT